MKSIYFIWSWVERFGANVCSFFGNIVLVYLLTPTAFGLVGALSVFSAMIWVLIDCGLCDSLLMYKSPSRRDFNTVFWFNVGMGVALMLFYIAISPWVARFFGHEELSGIMKALGVGAFFCSLTLCQITKLRSKLQFRRVALINLAAIISALAVAITMAWAGAGYWALVFLQAGFSAFSFLYLVIFSRWDLRFEFDRQRFKKFWSFGGNLLIATMVTQISRNIYTFILGKFYSPVQTAYMYQGQKLQETPTGSIETSFSQTSYVLIAKETDPIAKRDAFARMFGVMTFIYSSLVMFLLCVSAPLITVVFPDAWLPVIPYFRLLLLIGLFSSVGNFMVTVFKLFDRTSVIRNIMLLEKSAMVVLALIMGLYGGVYQMLLSTMVLEACALLLYGWLAQRVAGVSLVGLISTWARNVLLAAVACALAWALSQLFPWALVQLIVGCAAFVGFTLLLCYLFKREYYDYIMSKVRGCLHRG